jgi:tRNA(Ile2) C34 agmatinyltransferase TiaS
VTGPSCPQCGGTLASVCFLGTGVNGYYCARCRSYLDTALRPLTRPDCQLAEVTP